MQSLYSVHCTMYILLHISLCVGVRYTRFFLVDMAVKSSGRFSKSNKPKQIMIIDVFYKVFNLI